MSKRFFAILVAIIMTLGLVFIFTKDTGNNGSSTSNAQPSNHVFGEGKKGVTLIEYGDFQCPACGGYYPIIKELKERYKSDITFQFRNFPLVQIHQNAFAGSRAAEAAAKQDKFWEMHDLLYEQQETWGQASSAYIYFEAYAKQLGLDTAKFKQDYESQEVGDVINADVKAAQSLGASSTPTFVLDGKKLDKNPADAAAFTKLIDDTIAAKNQ